MFILRLLFVTLNGHLIMFILSFFKYLITMIMYNISIMYDISKLDIIDNVFILLF